MKYFGTDGVRGKFGEEIDKELSYRVGLAAASVCGGGEVVVGRDTRVSGEELTDALVDGLTRGGCNVRVLGILPTPAVAHETVYSGAGLGIMVSASHNPPEYNGIKIFDSLGYKLGGDVEEKIERLIDNPPSASRLRGRVTHALNPADAYVNARIEAYKGALSGITVCLDCAFGAAYEVAGRIFEGCGANVKAYNNEPYGEKINGDCGALYPEYVLGASKRENVTLGFAFDGDADRLSVAFGGKIIDGDSVLYNLYKAVKPQDKMLVGTVLSNMALERKIAKEGGRLIRTDVGDKYVCEKMRGGGYALGGEQSGHYIISPATTGDGVLSALTFAAGLSYGGAIKPPEMLELTPQKSISLPAPRSIMESDGIKKLTEKYSEELKPNGRILVRYSGTEPKIRVMAESNDISAVDKVLEAFRKFIISYKV